MAKTDLPPHDLFAPRYWPTWLAFGLLRLMVMLPYRVQLAIGRVLGRFYQLFVRQRNTIMRINLEVCFPELDDEARKRLARRSFESIGMSVVETAAGLWARDRFFEKLGTIRGIEHIEAATRQGKGVLLLSGHFCSADMAGRILGHHVAVCFTYRELTNELSDWIFRKYRGRYCVQLIHRFDLRTLIGALKSGEVVWYAPDQSQGRKRGVFVPFFGIPASTLPATTRLVRMTGAVVLPFRVERLPDARGYALEIEPPMDNFPGGDEIEDATRFNALLESWIRRNPEQYLWTHRRFQSRPPGEPKLYPSRKSRDANKKRRKGGSTVRK